MNPWPSVVPGGSPARKEPAASSSAVKRAIAAHRPGTSMAIRGRTIYLSIGRLPGSRGGRPRKPTAPTFFLP